MTKARVLVVEDEGVVALALQKCLAHLGHDVVGSVSSGEDAIKKSRELEPDVVLMDIRLRGRMDGIEAAGKISKSMGVPVIYLTAYSDDKTLERARSTEPFGYLLKPWDENAVRSAIEMTLYRAVSQANVKSGRDSLATILEGVSESIVATDFKGAVTFMNASAERMLGALSSEALGSPFQEVLHLIDESTGEPARLPASRALIEKQRVYLTNLLLKVSDGTSIPVDLNIAPMMGEGGSPTGMVLTFHERAKS